MAEPLVDASVRAAELAIELAACLGIAFGEISFSVVKGQVTHINKREVVHIADADRPDSRGIIRNEQGPTPV